MAEFTDDDDALLEELGVAVETESGGGNTALQQRVIAGFEEIRHFVETHGRPPQHGEEHDIVERVFARRLERLRSLTQYRELLDPLDSQQLLGPVAPAPVQAPEELDDDELLKELGVNVLGDLSKLRHVRSAAEKRGAEEIANRKICNDFAEFRPLFVKIKQDLDAGVRQTRPFQENAGIDQGQWFVVEGQIAYVAEEGDRFVTEYDRHDSRLRVIYDNGTESDVLMRSLQRALYRDGAGRRITDPSMGPLFSGELEDGDLASGTIYVVRSKSDEPKVSANRNLLHKIGVTGGEVERRIANTRLDPTFLMADVDLIATYSLSNINRAKLETVIHRIFDAARLDIEVKDRFGKPVTPREWFLVPLFVVDEAVSRIKDGSITDYVYDPKAAKLVKRRA